MSIKSAFLRYNYWLSDIYKGGKMWKLYKEARYILNNPNSSCTNDLIKARVHKLLEFAKSNVEFYKDKCDRNELRDFPIVSKQDFLDRQEAFFPPTQSIPNQEGDIHIQKTSGSTGVPFEIRQDTACRNRRIAIIKASNDIIGFKSFDPLMHLRAIKHYWNFPDDITWKPELQILYADNSNLTDEKVEKTLKVINDYNIKFVRGYMTTLDTLTRYAVNHGIVLKKHPTFISGGEHMLESLRLRVISMGCHIINQYANEENGVLGQSSVDVKGDEIILNRASCVVEILKIDKDEPAESGEIGRVVVTDYSNFAMPMIRYDIGDLAMPGEYASDGFLLSIKNLIGRKTDIIYKTDGNPIDLFNSISPEIYNNPVVRQWQFIQTGEKSYLLTLSVSGKTDEKTQSHLIDLMTDILGKDAEITLQLVDDIPVLSSGKRKVVVQKYIKNA